MDKLWYTHIIEYYPLVKNRILPISKKKKKKKTILVTNATTWMGLKGFKLSEKEKSISKSYI